MPSALLLAAKAGGIAAIDSAKSEYCLGWGSKCAKVAAEAGHLEVLRWCRPQRMPFGEQRTLDGVALASAVLSGRVDVVEWCLREGFGGVHLAICTAGRCGHVEILKRLDRGKRTDDECWDHAVRYAAIGGHLPALQW